jgi:hypothetical protein
MQLRRRMAESGACSCDAPDTPCGRAPWSGEGMVAQARCPPGRSARATWRPHAFLARRAALYKVAACGVAPWTHVHSLALAAGGQGTKKNTPFLKNPPSFLQHGSLLLRPRCSGARPDAAGGPAAVRARRRAVGRAGAHRRGAEAGWSARCAPVLSAGAHALPLRLAACAHRCRAAWPALRAAAARHACFWAAFCDAGGVQGLL